jgi:hypothetical protein
MKLARDRIQWPILFAMLNLRGLHYRDLEHSIVLRYYVKKSYIAQGDGPAQHYLPLLNHDPAFHRFSMTEHVLLHHEYKMGRLTEL